MLKNEARWNTAQTGVRSFWVVIQFLINILKHCGLSIFFEKHCIKWRQLSPDKFKFLIYKYCIVIYIHFLFIQKYTTNTFFIGITWSFKMYSCNSVLRSKSRCSKLVIGPFLLCIKHLKWGNAQRSLHAISTSRNLYSPNNSSYCSHSMCRVWLEITDYINTITLIALKEWQM